MQRVPVRLFTVAQPLHEHALELLPDPGRDLRRSGVVDEVQIGDEQTRPTCLVCSDSVLQLAPGQPRCHRTPAGRIPT